MTLSEEARAARRAYEKEWRAKNREHYNESIRQWRKNNPEKVRQYNQTYWERKAAQLEQEQQAR